MDLTYPLTMTAIIQKMKLEYDIQINIQVEMTPLFQYEGWTTVSDYYNTGDSRRCSTNISI